MDIEYIKEGKSAKATVEIRENLLTLRFGKTKTTAAIGRLAEMIIDSGKEYDDCIINYCERGSILIKPRRIMYKIHDREQNRRTSMMMLPQGPTGFILSREKQMPHEEIGILTAEGKIKNDKIRKHNQIDHL